MQAYQHKSVEELRFEDYCRGVKGQSSGVGLTSLGGGMSAGGGMFGGGGAGSTTSPFGKPAGSLGGAFGAPAATSAFGAPAGGGFGGTATTSAFGGGGAFGAPAATGGAFGSMGGGGLGGFGSTAAPAATGGFSFGTTAAPAATSAFGAPAGGAFGAPGSGAFGQPSTGAFGQPAATGAFGQPAAGGFGQPAATGGFGGSAFGQPAGAASPFGGAGGFGAAAAKPAGALGFGSPSTGAFGGGGFGHTAPATTGAFGGFGQTTTTPAGAAPAAGGFGGFGSSLGGFGSTTPTTGGLGGFGKPATATTNAFGTSTPASTGGFGMPAAGAGGFGTTGATPSFGAATLGGGGFGGFGAPAAATSFGTLGGGGFGTVPQQQQTMCLPQTNANGQPMTNLQQQQQLLLQVASLQQQQQQQDVASRIEMLRRKKDEITNASKESSAPETAVDQKATPNLFAGFVGAKASQPSAFYRSSPRSTARIVPRGVRGPGLGSPAPTSQGGNGSASAATSTTPGGALTNANTPFRSDNLLSPEPYSLGRNAKKLIVSTFKSPLPDVTEDLPPVPGSSAAGTDSPLPSMQQTPHRMDVSNTAAKSSRSAAGVTYSADTEDYPKNRSGEATGLTPAHAGTPYYARGKQVSPVNDPDDESDMDRSMLHHGKLGSPVSFRFSPGGVDISSSRRYSASGGKLNLVSSPPEEEEDEENISPVLTMPGYFSSPDISVLQKMSARELSKVKQFTIFRPNVGKIEWIGETDIRGLNFDQIVKIEKKEVFVYEDVTPAEQGTELNKPAVVTLCNIFPKEGSTEKKKAEFYRKLQDFCELNDADFISYDRNTGDWVFGVKHFSRYGLADSDDEDEGSAAAMQPADEAVEEAKSILPAEVPMATAASLNIMKLRQMLTKGQSVKSLEPGKSGFHSSLIGAASNVELSARRTPSSEKRGASMVVDAGAEMDTSDSPPLSRRRIELVRNGWNASGEVPTPSRASATGALTKSQLLTMEDVRNACQPKSPRVAADANASVPAFRFAADSPCMRIMMQVKLKAAAATGVVADQSAANYTQPALRTANSAAVTSVSCMQQGMRNYALSMGRSFRVGWSKDGKIVHAGKVTFTPVGPLNKAVGQCHRIVVEKVDTMRWAKRLNTGELASAPENILEAPLVAMLNASHHVYHGNEMTDTETAAERAAASNLSKLPLWRLPAADPAELHEYVPFLIMLKSTISAYHDHAPSSKHPDWVVGKALELVDATFGQEKVTFSPDVETRAVEMVPLYEDRQQYGPEVWERRRALLSGWIESVTSTQGKL